MDIKNYPTDSLITWVSVDPCTWEVLNQIDLSKQKAKSIYTSPSYSWPDIQKVRQTVWNWWEEKVKKILWCTSNPDNCWHDVVFPNGDTWEVKTRLSWTSWAVIKRQQLDKMNQDGFYILLYYILSHWSKSPTDLYVNNKTKLSSRTFLKRNMFLKSICILPVPIIKWFYNHERYKESIIKNTWVKFKTLSHSRAMRLYYNNPQNLNKYYCEYSDRVNNIIDIHSIGKPINCKE